MKYLLLIFATFFTLLSSHVFAAAPSPTPKTGQIVSYAARDDGALQPGVTWPTPRFTDNSDGSVTDNLTDLVWLKDPDCLGLQTWENALLVAKNLASGKCGLKDGSAAMDWYMPNCLVPRCAGLDRF